MQTSGQKNCIKHFIAPCALLLLLIMFRIVHSVEKPPQPFAGVCPPFFLKDEKGHIINPVANQNADVPYSPKQTCGTAGCHHYDKITRGYHFQQGKDEEANAQLKRLYQWVLSPGQYGGRW